jgi:hypothetical protein
VLVVGFGLVGCNDSAPEVFFPTWSPSGGAVPTGALEGHLVERGGCLFWSDDAEYLPIWPSNYRFEDSAVLAGSRLVLSVGDAAFLGGGERSLEQTESLIGSEIPGRCQAGGYWIVTKVVSDIGK